jgi:hypothetical protein
MGRCSGFVIREPERLPELEARMDKAEWNHDQERARVFGCGCLQAAPGLCDVASECASPRPRSERRCGVGAMRSRLCSWWCWRPLWSWTSRRSCARRSAGSGGQPASDAALCASAPRRPRRCGGARSFWGDDWRRRVRSRMMRALRGGGAAAAVGGHADHGEEPPGRRSDRRVVKDLKAHIAWLERRQSDLDRENASRAVRCGGPRMTCCVRSRGLAM